MEVMKVGVCSEHLSAAMDTVMVVSGKKEEDEVRVRRKAIKAVLGKCKRALELLSDGGDLDDDDDDGNEADEDEKGLSHPCSDSEAAELCDLLKSRVECPDFLQKLRSAEVSVPQQIAAEEGSSWDLVSANDLWEGGKIDLDQEDYVLVREEDIVEGIACFMAEYLLSLDQKKELTPNQLQEALRKTFSVKKKKGKLRKALDGTRVIYNVASWSATAIGIYQNPALLRAASAAFWTSCGVISKLF